MTNHRWFRRFSLAVVAAVLLAATACGDEPERKPKLNVQVFGWGPNEQGEVGFQPGLPKFALDGQVRVSLLHPSTGTLIDERSFSSIKREAVMPELSFGNGLRLDFELLDADRNLAAAGATPIFNFGEDELNKGFRVQVDRANSFAPVGSLVLRDGRSELAQSRLDYRAYRQLWDGEEVWLGRIGHAMVPVDGGNKALVVGGGYSLTSPSPRPGTLPSFTAIHDDLMEFDPTSGYFTDLSHDEQTRAPRPNGADRLLEPRAFHTVTPIGQSRFLVVGGLTPNDPNPRVLRSVELIDLEAGAGMRVQQLADSSGQPVRLNDARAYHTATYRPADNTVVVTGGVGRGGSDVLDSIEIIDLDTGEVRLGPTMRDARAEHEAVLMSDRQTIWILGGHDGSDAIASTESLRVTDGQNTLSDEGTMNTPRFGFAALRVVLEGREFITVIGGYTSLDGAVTDTYELSRLDGMRFLDESTSRLEEPRANPVAVKLSHSPNLVVLGGRGANHSRVGPGEVLVFEGLDDDDPYRAELTQDSSYNERSDFRALQLSNGKILMVGGVGRSGGDTTSLDNAEYFTPVDSVLSAGSTQ